MPNSITDPLCSLNQGELSGSEPIRPSTECTPLFPHKFAAEVTENDDAIFRKITLTDLAPEQVEQILSPPFIRSRQKNVLAVHWHPEFIPMELIEKRIHSMFPDMDCGLIIPTQHNELMTFQEYAGVEIDAYSRGFNQKVQLLLHFNKSRLENAHVLRSMLTHTREYRLIQLQDFIRTLTRPYEKRIQQAVKETGASEDIIDFVCVQAKKIQQLLDQYADRIPQDMFKNKLLRNFVDELRPAYGDAWILRAQTFLYAVKQIVKSHFSLRYFYRTSEVIEEVRALGGCIVIPHPEQFWPILLADYDVDGYEVWNPQSRKYTEFLIFVMNQKNNMMREHQRKLLLFMGDDTHMSEKIRDPDKQDREKSVREIGFQPAWDDLHIRKALIIANMNRKKVIEEYRERLG